MNKSNSGKKVSSSSSAKRPMKNKSGDRPAPKRASYKKESGADNKRGSFSRPTESSAKKTYQRKSTEGRSSESSSTGSRGRKGFATSYKRTLPEDTGDKKRNYTPKPPYKASGTFKSPNDRKQAGETSRSYKTGAKRTGPEDRKTAYRSKPDFDKTRNSERSGDTKKPYGAKPAYKTSRSSNGFDNKNKETSRPPYKTSGGRTVYDKRKTENGNEERSSQRDIRKTPYRPSSGKEGFAGKRTIGVRAPYKASADKRTGERRNTDKPGRGSKTSGNNAEGFDKKKKAYGSADTFTSRSTLKSITEKEEKPARRSSFKDKDNFVKDSPFTKKSEMKGYKPRVKAGEQEQDFRFAGAGAKGKEIKVDAKEAFVSKNKSQSKERVTENELYSGGEIRLNRYISNAGVSSRREADDLIGAGLVTINGAVVVELGTKVKAGDVVKFNGQKLAVEAKVYIVLNKPKDAITTSDDPDGRNTVMDLFEGKMKERIFPVGRLDRNTTGVLLLTNDGELANRLMHPKYEINKVYKATLNKNLKSTDLWTLANGVMLDDGMIKPDAIAQSDAKDKNIVGIEIHSGKNRIIHRMFEHIGYTVDKLDRVLYAGMEKGSLKRGEWRELSDKEIKALKRIVHLR